ncbi:N-terminal C2 in EEIG1 and EHBP1 proteins-domain-containing protein [Microdochium trichocladiopsis]|uniref:N-terminal C2 in EEIG1 and EHBP1 proteins-domain-containing protein n=1 Tax=Microdochium trichocladiopsis TaxID=1682393 RepID=A0A9P8YFS8_9PEZI|nr:N-terminal C2 in EEIG1 and EHBP1 proteins-domain-containing protein [Microdochium trichocladiopsis]KAH7037215.1 N-terminal C2 in EEIG1 and EHBP1 proteins-domain-containing protein [Microdochium trichocladiopsis]
MASLINKGRKPKFELHLTIYDLSNVPFKQGSSTVKWHLPHSMHAEHRGRTDKATTDWLTHRATYNYTKVVPVRIAIDRANNLAECAIEFEVLHDFPSPPGVKPDKGTIGTVRLNLSEYVEESEVYSRRRSVGAVGASRVVGGMENAKEKIAHGLHSSHGVSRHRRSGSAKSYSSSGDLGPGDVSRAIDERNELPDDPIVEEGIIRRYLMHDCKINSTLKIGILMVQVDGDRNYAAPPLRSAPMFGGIAGIVGDQESYSLPVAEPSSTESALAASLGETSNFSIIGSHDATELVDMYRRALAASYSCMPGELPADECIEDIFMGGDGSGSALYPATYTTGVPREDQRFDKSPPRHDHRRALRDDESNTSARTSGSGSPSDDFNSATLRPSEAQRARSHMRQHSGGSDKSALTVTNIWGRNNGGGDNGPGLSIPSGSYGHSSRHRGGGANRYPTSIPSAPTRGSGLADHEVTVEGQNESILRSVGLRGQRGQQDDSAGGGVNGNGGSGNDAGGTRSGSMGSMLSHNGRNHNHNGRHHSRHRSRECSEEDMREDLIAWKLPGAVK